MRISLNVVTLSIKEKSVWMELYTKDTVVDGGRNCKIRLLQLLTRLFSLLKMTFGPAGHSSNIKLNTHQTNSTSRKKTSRHFVSVLY